MAKKKIKKISYLYKQQKKSALSPSNPYKKKKKLERMAKSMSGKMTAPEKKFFDLINDLGIKIEPQKIVGGKIFDFYLPTKNILVEIDGDYYHGNPEVFEEQKLNNMQKRNKRNDKKKDVIALGTGFKLERVWEKDLNKNYEIVKAKFKKLLK